MKVWQVPEHLAAAPPTPAPEGPADRALAEAAACLRSGGLVAFPTETVYGLGANALDDAAVRRVFAAKGRPADNPLIVHIHSVDMLPQVTGASHLPPAAERAIAAFWPGPLTLILPAGPRLAPSVVAGLDTVGVRMPSHPVARRLIELAGCPVAAPSANRSGRPSPTDAAAVLADLDGRIDGLVDGGACPVGLESTVAWIGEDQAVIYRPGGVTREELEAVIGVPVAWDPHLVGQGGDLAGPPKSPGMKYRHYAPDADVYVWTGPYPKVIEAMQAFLAAHPDEPAAVIAERPVDFCPWHWAPSPGEKYEYALARELYRLLRTFDRRGARLILVQGLPREGLGAAVMNRLEKAAAGRVFPL